MRRASLTRKRSGAWFSKAGRRQSSTPPLPGRLLCSLMRATADESAFLLITRSVSLAASTTRAITPSPPFLCSDLVRLRPIRATSDNRESSRIGVHRGRRRGWVQGERERERTREGNPPLLSLLLRQFRRRRGLSCILWDENGRIFTRTRVTRNLPPLSQHFSLGYCFGGGFSRVPLIPRSRRRNDSSRG